MRRAARVDDNQNEIVEALRKAGAVVIITSQMKNFADLLVCYMGTVHIVEVKDGNKPPSQRKLTEGEQECKIKVESVLCKYNIVNNIEEALELISKPYKMPYR